MSINEEDMTGLSDEERAAIEDDDDESENPGASDGDTDKEDDEDSAPVAIGAEPEPDPESEDDSVLAQEEFQPELKTERPEGLTERLAELEEQTKSLMQQFKEGDIEVADFVAQKETIDAEKHRLSMAESQAKWAEEQNADTSDQRWKWEQERFFAQEKSDVYKNPMIMAALNASVKQLGADPANAKRPAAYFLEEADRQVRKLFGMGAAAGDKPGPKQPDLSKVPKTLSQLPSAEMAETGEVEFAYQDKLDGMALEVALRKMTPEQEARYLGSAA